MLSGLARGINEPPQPGDRAGRWRGIPKSQEVAAVVQGRLVLVLDGEIDVAAAFGEKIMVIVVGAAIVGPKGGPVAARDALPQCLCQACENGPEDGEEPERPDDTGARGYDEQHGGERQHNREAAEHHRGVSDPRWPCVRAETRASFPEFAQCRDP